MKILFLLKQRDAYSQKWTNDIYEKFSSGLSNSVNFISTALNKLPEFETRVKEVIDNNYIDKEVRGFNPDVIIIEALWVIPEKFEILTRLYPDKMWIVRLHSESPFLACEGVAYDWIFKYLTYDNVFVAANSKRLQSEINTLLKSNKSDKQILYLPNYYPVRNKRENNRDISYEYINIGCFGAIRPLKNQLIQAEASIKFADSIGKKLKFYINGTRKEMQGDPVYKNIKALFDNMKNHELVEITWLDHDAFLDYIYRNIDIGIQVSFTETFNIVTADFVSQNIPVVTSSEVAFVDNMFLADPTSINSIYKKLKVAYKMKKIGMQSINRRKLINLSREALQSWRDCFRIAR